MRSRKEEIDGRDGDIITKLGYSAYDKQMSIGLFGDFDIDEVIQFFDSEGTVIFSNEPDKFYKYTIINQIDFERLIRFRTAMVTFHVQPFKYSAVDDNFTFTRNRLTEKIYSQTKKGITCSSNNGIVSIKGTGTATSEFYVPINPMTLDAGNYTLNAITVGTGENGCKIRVIESVPTDADSFGGSALNLADSGLSTLSATLTEEKTFNYLWVSISSGAKDFTLDAQLMADDVHSFEVFNRGNIFARPTLTIHGSGTIELIINGDDLFTINLGSDEYITLDAIDMNAYKGEVLKNRLVIGDYSNLQFKIGTNVISWTGIVTRVDVSNESRWI
jgi:predicted phage tail component-like protein